MKLLQALANSKPAKFLGQSISRKLFALLFLVGVVPMLIVAVLMYQSAYNGIESKSLDQLEAIKTVKANQVKDYFHFIENQVLAFSENRMIVEAMSEFPAAEQSAREEAGVTDAQLVAMKKDLQGYYAQEFGKEYVNRNPGKKPPLKDQFQLDDDSLFLQHQYISSNPNPLGSKENMDTPEDGTRYSELHAKYHPVVRGYLQKFGYYDIFLCDIETGDIVYSVFKELDFTTSLSTGPYSNTNFGRAFQLAAAADSPDDTFLVDYEHYVPSYEDPASFISSPIFDGDKKIGVAIFQMPIEKISAIMDERTGLGESGETYAVGPEGLMRNDSRFEAGTILKRTVDTTATQSALQGGTGKEIIADYRGVPVLSSWSPVTIHEGVPGVTEPLTWALMSEIDHAEIKKPISFFAIAKNGILVILLSLAIGGGLVWFVASRIARQAKSIQDMLGSVGMGMFDARAEKVTNDELGDVSVALNAMCDNTLALIQSDDERQSIQSSIEGLIGEMEQIASGNLGVNAEVKEDITGSIAGTVNHMTEQLRNIVQRVQNASYLVTSSADEIAEASTQLSAENEMQAERIGQTSAQVLEITDQFQTVAQKTEDSVQVAQKARETATRGYRAVSDTVEGMERIREQVQSTSKRIKRLGESSQEIGEIVQLISDIADRTSILALNASIQASMAGDAGQGFAVVAEEVERLAERSTDATKQISTLIKTIQTETSEAITDMEESTREVVEGSQLATQAGQTLAEIDEVSQTLEELIQSVSGSATQQAAAAEQIAQTMNQISETTKSSAEKSRESTEQVAALATLAGQLGDSVSQFRLEESRIENDVMNQIDEVSAMAAGNEASAEEATYAN